MNIVGFSGKMGSGKDYTAEQISKLLKKENSNYKISFMSFANELRVELDEIVAEIKKESPLLFLADKYSVKLSEINIVYNLLLEDGAFQDETYSLFNRTDKSRDILQYWGTDVRRKQDKDYWVNLVDKRIKSTKCDFIFITDVRFENEQKCVTDNGGIVIRCFVNGDEQQKRLNARGVKNNNMLHSSEIAMNGFKANYHVDTSKKDSIEIAIEIIKNSKYVT